jgi:hypothetical protein
MIQPFSSFAAEAELSEEMLGNVFANYEMCVTYRYIYIYININIHIKINISRSFIHTYIHCITLPLHYITLHTYITIHNHT